MTDEEKLYYLERLIGFAHHVIHRPKTEEVEKCSPEELVTILTHQELAALFDGLRAATGLYLYLEEESAGDPGWAAQKNPDLEQHLLNCKRFLGPAIRVPAMRDIDRERAGKSQKHAAQKSKQPPEMDG